jgi:hypothetical protein
MRCTRTCFGCFVVTVCTACERVRFLFGSAVWRCFARRFAIGQTIAFNRTRVSICVWELGRGIREGRRDRYVTAGARPPPDPARTDRTCERTGSPRPSVQVVLLLERNTKCTCKRGAGGERTATSCRDSISNSIDDSRSRAPLWSRAPASRLTLRPAPEAAAGEAGRPELETRAS